MTVHKGVRIGFVVFLVILAGMLLGRNLVLRVQSQQLIALAKSSPTLPVVKPAEYIQVSSSPSPTLQAAPTRKNKIRRTPVPQPPATIAPTTVVQAEDWPPTLTPVPCNLAGSGSPLDVTIPDGYQVEAGQSFTKVWRIQNAGSCTWTSNYSIVWSSGQQFSAAAVTRLSSDVLSGESVDVLVEMIAPQAAGEYHGEWRLSDPSGNIFGLGLQGEAPLHTRIIVTEAAAPTIEPSPTATSLPSPTANPYGRISGRVLVNGAPVSQQLRLSLEDQSTIPMTQATTGADGSFVFPRLDPSTQGYNLVFTAAEDGQFELGQIASWVWLGPIPVQAGEAIQLPDLDVSLLGFGQSSPLPEASVSAAAISPATPLSFEWLPYPGASTYWVDVVEGDEALPVWQSTQIPGTRMAFQGTLANGSAIQPGEYWWAIGMHKTIGPYTLSVYSNLTEFTVAP